MKCTDGGVKRSFDLQTRRFCRKIEAEEKTSLQKVLGVCIGVSLVFCCLLTAYHINKRPGRARRLNQSMLQTEFKIVAKLLFDVRKLPA